MSISSSFWDCFGIIFLAAPLLNCVFIFQFLKLPVCQVWGTRHHLVLDLGIDRKYAKLPSVQQCEHHEAYVLELRIGQRRWDVVPPAQLVVHME